MKFTQQLLETPTLHQWVSFFFCESGLGRGGSSCCWSKCTSSDRIPD